MRKWRHPGTERRDALSGGWHLVLLGSAAGCREGAEPGRWLW